MASIASAFHSPSTVVSSSTTKGKKSKISFSSNVTDTLLPQLYGEWSLWYADIKSFVGPNKVMVYLYPRTRIEIVYKRMMGPLLFVDRDMGTFCVESFNKIDTDDISEVQVANHNFSQEKKQISTAKVKVLFHERTRSLISLFGIGLDEFDMTFSISSKRVKPKKIETMELFIVGRDDLFLSTEKTTFHLLRSAWMNQPTISVQFSTLIVTQLIGMYIGYLAHLLHLVPLSGVNQT